MHFTVTPGPDEKCLIVVLVYIVVLCFFLGPHSTGNIVCVTLLGGKSLAYEIRIKYSVRRTDSEAHESMCVLLPVSAVVILPAFCPSRASDPSLAVWERC